MSCDARGDFYDGGFLDDVGDNLGPPPWDALVGFLTRAVAARNTAVVRRHAVQLAEDVRRFGGAGASCVLGESLIQAVSACWDRGWQPADLAHVIGRGLKPAHRAMLGDITALEAHPYLYAPNAEPGWLAQTAAVMTKAQPPDRSGLLDHWSRRNKDLATVIVTAVQLLNVLHQLPTQPRLCDPPSAWATNGGGSTDRTRPGTTAGEPGPGGTTRPGRTGSNGGGFGGAGDSGGSGERRRGRQAPDPKVMQRVRALLAKAESTEFPEEAEAFTAKAQELIARHAIDQAMLEAGAGDPGLGTSGRRVLIDDPYARAKSVLLGQVVAANRCTAVWQSELSLSTVFGLPDDIDAVELLFTSLLTQATAAMVAAGGTLGTRGRERSFRQSFLVAFASRIGERLLDANTTAVDEARHRHGDDVLPVLANREKAAVAARDEAFPRLRKQRISTSNYDGWIAGRAAADAARLGPEAAISRR